MQARYILFIAAVLGAAGVGLGAFAAHGLKAQLSDQELSIFQTGVKYQMIHVLAILLSVILYKLNAQALSLTAAWFFLAGIFLFSGSLYLLANKSLLHIEGWSWLGPVTPLGGLAFITGWLILAWSALRMKG